ncbi:MAG: GAF domain-containing protein [Actinobacteria bacterium]|nr:GAF domain-containing protein [Actinomycetota bacterium]
MERAPAASGDGRILLEIISTVGSSLDLEEVLRSVVRLLTDAAAVHACFVYLIEDDGQRLVMRAASQPYGHLVGRIALERGEGLAWWVIEHREPSFMRENAPDDPRFKFVPELEEEQFQSLISAPILARAGEPIGAISMHTEAPREFSEPEVDVLVSTASLVAGAIDNARLYEETRQRVGELENLTALGEQIARAESRDELLPEVAARARRLLRADACHLYVADRAQGELRLHSSSPGSSGARTAIPLAEIGQEVGGARSPAVALPLLAGDELLGLFRAEGTAEVDLARAVANQTAVALAKIDLIERLTEKNLIKDFFEELAGGRPIGDLEGRATRLGFDLDARYLVLAASPPAEALEAAIAAVAPGSLFDRRDDLLRALLRVTEEGVGDIVERVRNLATADKGMAIGLSNLCSGAASFAAGFEEARHALIGATVLGGKPGVVAYEELGPYKYLLRMSLDVGVRDPHREAVARLAEYDREHSTSLLPTLEEFLRRHGSIAATASALYVHPNTLRQRLGRISSVSAIDLREDDWLAIEIAVKLVKLEEALGPGAAGGGPGRV